ncbi:hypothetical protein [Modicisalibacter xianhensis]|uniref:Uncharacterized protein n=1 Tax=Modicisalibacter xianhensis TaxID=442341 RepID=A0A1I3FTD3_9GAMM|nr:hypothetical protein [Halomonas xianhensis]SFI14332.1 hypothetical protein SAMN04487959_1217 [Halomonas xianhensis]
MKAAVLLLLVGLAVALLAWFPETEDQARSDIDSMHRHAAITDARIALANSQAQCMALADGQFGKEVTESLNYVGLKPDYQRVFQEGGGQDTSETPPNTPSDSQRKDLRAEFDSLGHAGLVLIMCLRHLDDEGIVPLGKSVPAVADRLALQVGS